MAIIPKKKIPGIFDFKRQNYHIPCDCLESLVSDVNSILGNVEIEQIKKYDKNKYPLILVLGSPRCGTTLFMQLLASCGHFAYPTNLLSRFYAAPYIGAMIQLMLTKYDFNGELSDFNLGDSFRSRLGKTKGVLSPHEFSYFWRRYFHFGEIHKLTDSQVNSFNRQEFISEIAAIESVFDKPLAMKAGIVSWDIPLLHSFIEKILFVHIRRAPIYNIQSLLKARLDYYGDVRAWYSFRPPEYMLLKSTSPVEQVVGQIYYTNQAIEKHLSCVNVDKKLVVNYDEFCQRPQDVFTQIKSKCEAQGYSTDWGYVAPDSFQPSRELTLSNEEIDEISKAYFKITGERISL